MGVGWDIVLRFKHTSRSVGECKDVNFKHFQNEKHFGCWSVAKVLNLWNKNVSSKHGPTWGHNISLERFWNVDLLKVSSHFPFGVMS
jgi:hypothetical protein